MRPKSPGHGEPPADGMPDQGVPDQGDDHGMPGQASSHLAVRFETEVGVVDLYFVAETPATIIDLLDRGLRLTCHGDCLRLNSDAGEAPDFLRRGTDAWLTTPFQTASGRLLVPTSIERLAARMRPGSSLWPRHALLFETHPETGLPVVTSRLLSPEAL